MQLKKDIHFFTAAMPSAKAKARLFNWPKVIKRNFPRTLMARVLWMIVLPIVIMQITLMWVFFTMHYETVTGKLIDGVVGDVAWAVDAYKQDPQPANLARVESQAQTMGLSVRLQDGPLPETHRHSIFLALDHRLDAALDNRLDDPYWFDTVFYRGFIDIRVQLKTGVLRIIAPKDRTFASTGYIFFFWIVGATALLTTVAMLFIRNQVRAIERLAQAAEKFGRGEDDPNFKPYGASEVRAAAEAFLKMKARIQRQIEQRTTLLASVSHDLRTPLTRLKLELAMNAQDAATARMQQDVSEMAYMIDEYLAFARGEMAEEPENVPLRGLMETVADNIRRGGHELETDIPEDDAVLNLRQMAVQRAISNLIINGFHYGKHVHFSAERDGDQVRLFIDDDGPGIPAEKHEEAFKPFSRLDEARNQNIKGVGLGLAIARDIVRGHGGDLILDRSPSGGLRAIISLLASV